MKKKVLIILTSFLLLLTGGIAVYASNPITLINNVRMGNVSIAIQEHQLGENPDELVPFVQDQILVPCDSVSKIVTIVNEGEPAWIRVKIGFDTNAKVNLTEDEIVVKDGWERKSDGFYYWKKEVPRNGKVQFLDSFTLPCKWTSKEISKAEFKIHIQADAVQTRHFTPKFNTNDPWFGTLIEKSSYNYTSDWKPTDRKNAVVFVNGAEGFFANTGDAFSNWETLMPGDTLTDTVNIGNSYNKTVKLLFKTENEKKDLLEENVNLKIWRGTELIFDGKLADTRNEAVLAVMEPGTNFVLKYQLDVPEELNNRFSLEYGQVKWIFRAEVYDRVNTAANNSVLLYSLVAIASAAAVLYVIYKKSRKEE